MSWARGVATITASPSEGGVTLSREGQPRQGQPLKESRLVTLPPFADLRTRWQVLQEKYQSLGRLHPQPPGALNHPCRLSATSPLEWSFGSCAMPPLTSSRAQTEPIEQPSVEEWLGGSPAAPPVSSPGERKQKRGLFPTRNAFSLHVGEFLEGGGVSKHASRQKIPHLPPRQRQQKRVAR